MPTLERSRWIEKDSLNRREFLRVGSLAIGGLTLGDVLRLRAASSLGKQRQKSVIMIFLSGGPSHLDMYDMKPQAPREYRGEFSPIRTNVPGMEVCELMPHAGKNRRQVRHPSRRAFRPSAHGQRVLQRLRLAGIAAGLGSGRSPASGARLGGQPLPASRISIPPYVSLENQPDWERAYYAGMEHEPFRVGGGNAREALTTWVVRRQSAGSDCKIGRTCSIRCVRSATTSTAWRWQRAVDAFQTRALEIVASGKVREAFDH